MFTIYWSSLGIGLVIGLSAGIAIALWAAWSTDKELYKSFGSDWSRGYDKGWISGAKHQQLEDMRKYGKV